jgi:hypothetical protein
MIFIAALRRITKKDILFFFVMPQYSYCERYIFSCHLDYQMELLSSFLITLPYHTFEASHQYTFGRQLLPFLISQL